MKWGVRRQKASVAREQRYKTGKQTLRDKIIRDADLDPGHKRPALSSKAKKGQLAVAAILIAYGGVQTSRLIKEIKGGGY